MYKSSFIIMITTLALAAPLGDARASNVQGKVEFDLELGIGGGREMMIREPSMCAGDASVKVKWNKNQNRVRIHAKFDGLPYRPSFCFEEDPSTAYNQYPLCVEDGKWQMWFATRLFTRTSTYYYDMASGDLIGNEFDLPAGPPPGSLPVVLPVAQMVCTHYFESNPANLKANVIFDFDYDGILDGMGSPGTLLTLLPFNLYDDDSYWLHYTNEILPMTEVQHWDDTLADLDAGLGGFVISTSVEPDPKPPGLLTHDQLMIGWTDSYPDALNEPLPPEVFDDPSCGTEQIYVPFPGGALPG